MRKRIFKVMDIVKAMQALELSLKENHSCATMVMNKKKFLRMSKKYPGIFKGYYGAVSGKRIEL